MDSEEEEEPGLCETADENLNMVDTYSKYGNVDQFFHRKEKVFARAAVLKQTEVDVFLNFEFDLDGCVVEIRDLGELTISVRHLTIIPRGNRDVRPIYSFLKKHLDLTIFLPMK